MLKVPSENSGAEIELILCCSRTFLRPGDADKIQQLLGQQLDWEYLVRTASLHCVLTLLCQHLKAFSASVPRAAWDYLQSASQRNTRHNFQLTRELLKILKFLESHDIPVVPLKGPVLAASAYGNLALRQFGDLDVWFTNGTFSKLKSYC
jgi:hypothetical protein